MNKRPFSSTLVLLCSSLFVALSLAADERSGEETSTTETEVVKAEITVTGKPSPPKTQVTSDIRALPVNASVLFDPATEVMNAREPGEMVRALPGMDFVFYGQGGIPSGPSVRGYTDRNFGQDIAGFFDGIPLNLFGFVASHGALDLTVLPTHAIERIELIRGPFNARYGDFHRGGSLHFVTRSRISRSSVDVAGGSFDTARLTVTHGRDPVDGMAFFTTLEGYRTDSYSNHSDLYRVNSYSKLLVPLGRNELSLAGTLFKSEWDAPSYLDLALVESGAISDRDVVNPTDGGNQDSQIVSAVYRGSAGTPEEWSATLYGYHRDWDRWRHDQLISPATTQLHQSDDRITLGVRIEKNFGGPLLGRPSLLLAGVTAQRDDAETRQERTVLREVRGVVDDVDEVLLNSAMYVQEQWSPAEWIKLSGGLRYNHLDYDLHDTIRAEGTYVSDYSASRWNPNLGVALNPFGMQNVLVYGSMGNGMRSPTPRSEVRNSVNSVRRISIAQTRNYEAGVSFRLAGLEMQANVFRSDNSDEIRAIPPGIEFESLGRSRREGAEFEATWFSAKRTARVYTNLSWVDARLLTPTNPAATRFPDVADHVHRIGFEKSLALDNGNRGGLFLGGDWAFYGEKNLNTLGTIRSDPYQRATARASYVPQRGQYRIWAGGFYYPASRYGESAFLFGPRVGVRANPRSSFEVGVSRSF